MARRKKPSRPSDPTAIARKRAAERVAQRDPARWGLARDALDLPAHAAVEATVDGAGRIARARRRDVFDLLHGRGKLAEPALTAVRRLQDDIARLHRTGAGCAAYAPRVDGARRPDDFTEARAAAGRRIEAVLALAGGASANLLLALCEAEFVLGRAADWRQAVARVTGETLPDAQGAVLRMACENLATAYGRVDRAKGRG